MKLYTTIQAEKLTNGTISIVKKSQGSNTHLDINIIDEAGALMAHLKVHALKSGKPVIYFTSLPQHAYITTNQAEYEAIVLLESPKGKQQIDNE